MIIVTRKMHLKLFEDQWEREQGYKPAAFQKAIAMRRLDRGQSVREVIDALIAQREGSPL